MMYYSHPHASRVRTSQSGGRQRRVHDVRSVTNIPSYFIGRTPGTGINRFCGPENFTGAPYFKERKKPAHILSVIF
jgi:hypothetical protein